MKHKHYEVIIAFAEGKKIQRKNENGDWEDWISPNLPRFYGDKEYRIKPEPKPDVYVFIKLNTMYGNVSRGLGECDSNIKAIIDGETGKLKSAEVI